jgi:multidrug resistance efflux pump
MMPNARVRSVLRPLIVVVAVAALIVAAVRFSRTVAAPSATTPADAVRGNLVCFGTVDFQRGVASLSPLQPGRVAEVLVSENQVVARGAELLRLEDGIANKRLAEADAGVALAQLQLQHARKQPELHRRRIAQQQSMHQATESRSAAARHAVLHQEQLARSVVVPQTDKSVRQDKVGEAEALERAEAERLAELQEQDVELAFRRADYELKAAEARREQARLARDECRLKAPCSGTVRRIMVSPGDMLVGQPAEPAVLFAADGPQVIRATVEQEFASRVKEGEPALVRDEFGPAASWRGRVQRVAGWYKERRTVLHDPSQLSDVRTLECVVVLEPGQPRLRLGQSVRVLLGIPSASRNAD